MLREVWQRVKGWLIADDELSRRLDDADQLLDLHEELRRALNQKS